MKKNGMLTALLSVFAFFFALAVNSSGQAQTDRAQADKRPLKTFARDALNLTPEQEARLEELRKVRREENRAFREEMRKLRSAFRDVRENPKADGEKIEALIDEMARIKAEHLKSGLRHGREAGNLFTPEQLEKLKTLRGIRRDRHFMERGRKGGRLLNRGRFLEHQGLGGRWVPRNNPRDPGLFQRDGLDWFLR